MMVIIFFCFFLFMIIQPFGTQFVRALPQQGFISIDCGFEGSSGYQNNITGLNYTGDGPYIATGENRVVSSNPFGQLYATLRSFPNGTRNCYSLSPVQPGQRYLIRAEFYHGNYDGKGLSPTFDLHLGVNFWTTIAIRTNGGALAEIITVARRQKIEVCLINTNRGTPYISLLELRPLLYFMYPFANESQSLLMSTRWNYGTRDYLRYPDDPYDRKWDADSGEFLPLNTSRQVQTSPGDPFQIPSVVLQTARSFSKTNYNLRITAATASPGERMYIVLHFSELLPLNPANESRILEIYGGDAQLQLFTEYRPPFLVADHKEIINAVIGQSGTYTIAVYVKNTSTQPYIINAMEGFIVRPMNESQTDDRDVTAIEDVKKAFKLTRNWEADPCSPRQYVWQGLVCSYDASANARITSLNLSFSSLVGAIPLSIGNLTALTTLDLSGNNLSGPIPDILGDISSLKILDLSGNEAIGSIPRNLCGRVSKGVLLLRGGEGQCKSSGKNNKTTIISVSVAVSVVFLMILIFIWIFLRRRKAHSPKGELVKRLGLVKERDTRQRDIRFTNAKIKQITRNFEQEIGKGGFGPVYLGHLDNATQVAVKVLSATSSHGSREFEAEVLLLGRVHHKNLVCLLGYCDEPKHLSLVYEYMDNGNLREHLSGEISGCSLLNWRQRVSIALQAAQGLDYLHNGCRPSIVHRDIKSSNILLNSSYVAKIADFGLSRAFSHDNATHITTGVAGTPGYLDPEYFQNYRLDEKSDVYSFGIVLLEILTGQPPYMGSAEKTHIVKWVRTRVEAGDINNIVDPNLHGDFEVNEAWKMVEVAMSCTAASSTERMPMGDVVMALKQCIEINVPDYGIQPVYSDKSPIIPLISGEYALSAPTAR
ncbi:putative LRR receptor-like serine/threonine-protein kinase At1g05700 [Wolffia australiana]